MVATHVSKHSHGLWLHGALFAGALMIILGLRFAVRDSTLAFPWSLLLFLAWMPPYFFFGFRLIQWLGARVEWRIDLINREKHRVELIVYPSQLPSLEKYLVFVDGKERARQRGSWRRSSFLRPRWHRADRVEFQFGEDPVHQGVVTIMVVALWPFQMVSLALEVDGRWMAAM